MAKQMDKYFNLNETRDNLNRMEKGDKLEKLNLIITTLTLSCTESPEEAVGTLDLIRTDLKNIFLKCKDCERLRKEVELLKLVVKENLK